MSIIDTIVNADASTFLKTLPDNYINCVVTSPPYYALRDYGVDGQIGLEETPAEFIAKLVAVFREVRRVLREDGVCWVNMGDSYTGGGRGDGGTRLQSTNAGANIEMRLNVDGLPPKNRLGMPHRLVFALQDDDWIWRDEVVWHKPNPMPESVTDRTTKAHEYVFMLTKRPRYWYDADAIREEAKDWGSRDRTLMRNGTNDPKLKHHGLKNGDFSSIGRNRRSVFTVPTEPTPFAHFATYPQALIEPLILAGCPAKVCAVCGAPHVRETERTPMMIRHSERRQKMGEFGRTQSSGTMLSPASSRTLGFTPTCTCAAETRAGIVYDPFMGSGTTALVARRLGRHYLGSELNSEYHKLATDRLLLDDTTLRITRQAGVQQLSMFDAEVI